MEGRREGVCFDCEGKGRREEWREATVYLEVRLRLSVEGEAETVKMAVKIHLLMMLLMFICYAGRGILLRTGLGMAFFSVQVC